MVFGLICSLVGLVVGVVVVGWGCLGCSLWLLGVIWLCSGCLDFGFVVLFAV